jgi:organic radical activating enzyme
MRLDDFRTIVDRVQRWALRASLYDMGEPLLNKRIWSMIRYCTDRGISTLISTNFNLFKPHDVDALFDSGLTVLEPCLDGYTQEAYATYRRNGDVETVKNNIRLVMEEKRRRDATYPLVDAQVGRSRYAEDSQATAARINLHDHFLVWRGVILQPFVRTRQHDHNIDYALRPAVPDASQAPEAQGSATEDHRGLFPRHPSHRQALRSTH